MVRECGVEEVGLEDRCVVCHTDSKHHRQLHVNTLFQITLMKFLCPSVANGRSYGQTYVRANICLGTHVLFYEHLFPKVTGVRAG